MVLRTPELSLDTPPWPKHLQNQVCDMANIGYIILLMLLGRVVGAIWTLVIGVSGSLGAAINDKGNSVAVKSTGFLVMLLGQTYASLSYVALTINLSERMIRPEMFGSMLAWIAAFLAACFPVWVAVKDGANSEEKNMQHITATVTLPLTIIGFFLLKFIPSLRSPLWSWTSF